MDKKEGPRKHDEIVDNDTNHMHLEPSDDMVHHKNERKQLQGTGMTATVI